LDLLVHKYGPEVISKIFSAMPPQYFGCVANFVFPKHYWMLETIPQMAPNIVATLGVHPKWATQFDQRMESFLWQGASMNE
jgi:hypothetical protein